MYTLIDTVVVGGGQAGLSVSWHLKQAGYDHVVLDRGQIGIHGVTVGTRSAWSLLTNSADFQVSFTMGMIPMVSCSAMRSSSTSKTMRAVLVRPIEGASRWLESRQVQDRVGSN